MISKIEYIDKYIGTDKEVFVKELDISLKCNDYVMHSQKIEMENEFYSLIELLQRTYLQFDEIVNRKEEVLICNKNDLIVEIDYLDVKNNIEKINLDRKAEFLTKVSDLSELYIMQI